LTETGEPERISVSVLRYLFLSSLCPSLRPFFC